MINEIKTIIQNYLNSAKLSCLMTGTATDDGIKVNDKLAIPLDIVKGNLKDFISVGDKVRLIRNHGGHEFYIVEIIGLDAILKGMTVSIEPITVSGQIIDHIKIKDVSR